MGGGSNSSPGRATKHSAISAIPPASKKRRTGWSFRGCVVGLAVLLLLLGAGGAGLWWEYQRYLGQLEPPDSIARRQPPSSSRILDRNGTLLYEIFDPTGGKRTLVPLAKISTNLRQATIATEDGDFYENPGFSIRGILRALVRNILSGDAKEGGSGITQQLVKNVLIPPEERYEKTFERKIHEAVLAFEITRRYSKDQILQWYLNEVNYGNMAYGVEAAARVYFGKSASDLTIAESALLAGLPQAPATYSPFVDPAAAKARQSEVLDLMVRRGAISESEATAARAVELKFQPPLHPMLAPHFVTYVRDRLESRYGRRLIQQGGLVVTTTLDFGLQVKAERAVSEGVKKLAAIDATNAALVAMTPSSGEVLAMVGSADFWNDSIRGQVNVATSRRQPGSTFKPISYLAAFVKGYSPATLLYDVQTRYPDGQNGDYVPQNADGKFRGPLRARDALAQSLNPPAVSVLQYAGLSNVIDLAHRLGITDLREKNRYGLSLTLGGGEVKLVDLTYAYGVLANNGVMAGSTIPPYLQAVGFNTLEPTVILAVADPWGNVIEEHRTPRQIRVTPAAETFLVTDVLSDNNARAPMFGYSSALKLDGRPAAVKTGTTTDYRDFWTVGYTPQLVTGVWVGNSSNRPMKKSFSSTTAAPIWNAFMTAALAGKPAIGFTEPAGLTSALVCSVSGFRPAPGSPGVVRELFVAGKAPTLVCPLHSPKSDPTPASDRLEYRDPPRPYQFVDSRGLGAE